jgi:uncharacterized YigZ family protein
MFSDTYKTIEGLANGVFKNKGSKFIAFAYPVKNETEVKEKLLYLKKEYHDARHHCFAYVLGLDKTVYRVNDDGEPSGTAGKPILGQINSKDLTNILIVVIRYFGGTLLGVSGLINAYKQATIAALNNANIIEKTVNEIYIVRVPYDAMNDVMKILKEEKAEIINQYFENENSLIKFSIRKSLAITITGEIEKIKSAFITFVSLSV